eukprot:CAMPEP_0173411736 /NCGR_PEP_ID=MMETSP1356-20130122/77789_1 /TAXON_ID=77927 ORGANISM="Hemiselmis virescens, Strain PCC157" /NCGR_SAMPLE_ID=MMETSP1356 /ASSEMBLY_ACC=CAM_ASM_000847 /LENGTH=39 /DNA_ID= /DNA_START= /DNA_END= /DNA_ORIENTATION=
MTGDAKAIPRRGDGAPPCTFRLLGDHLLSRSRGDAAVKQ